MTFRAIVLPAVLIGTVLLGVGGGSSAYGQSADPDVTFAKDVLPILQRSCQSCHRTGSIAPMSLISYEEVRPWARSIKRYVESREMPPWYIDRRIGIQKFKDEPSLTDEEIATIAVWVDAGAPRGDPADAPPPPRVPRGERVADGRARPHRVAGGAAHTRGRRSG